MKKLLAVLTAAILLSCGDAGDGGTQTASVPVHANLAGAKALFVSSRSGLARQATEDNTLFMIDTDGEIQPVAFTDAQGGTVNLTVNGELRNLARTFITFDFALGGQTRAVENGHTALVELDTGKVYDFTGKYAEVAIGKKEILYQNTIEVSSNWRYAELDGTLYYWNMNTANAIPLNNPQYDSPDASYTIPLKDNKIVLMSGHFSVPGTGAKGEMYIYDLTAKNAPEYFTGTLFHNISNDMSDLMNIHFYDQIPIITLNKTLYSFWINGKDIGVNKDGVELAPLIGADISGENAVLNTGITFYEHVENNNSQVVKSYNIKKM